MKCFEWLDRIQFLRLSIWDFSARSLLREYGWLFTTRVLLRHPIRAIKGMSRYRKTILQNRAADRLENVIPVSEPWEGGQDSIVGVGFCLKPLDPACISGRSNHDCHFLEHNLQNTDKAIPECCRDCTIRRIGTLTLATGSHFYIMTSAKDILFDMLSPSIEDDAFPHGLFVICRYSFEPFRIALAISGIEGTLLPFESGDCRDYETWLLADDGVKEERTELTDDDGNALEQLLLRSAMDGSAPTGFVKKDNIFYSRRPE